MHIHPVVIGIALFALGVWLFFRWRSARPAFPPLEISHDDPLMIEAVAQARESLHRFFSLAREDNAAAFVKLNFVSNAGQVEHLWAEVLEVLGDTELGVRLQTPPVTHAGQLDRLYRCAIGDIEDWQVRDGAGHLHGGYTQKAMFAIARRDGVALPKRLLQHEADYADT